MKRIMALSLICILLCLAFPSLGYADGRTIELNEPKMSLTIPDSYYVLSTDGLIDDYAVSLLGYDSSDEWKKSAREDNIYLDAFSPDFLKEIVVTRIDNLLTNFSELPDAAIKAFIPTLVKVYAAAGYSVEKQTVESINGVKYVVLECSGHVNSLDDCFIQHYTIIDSNAINVTYHNYSGIISLEERRAIDDLMNSISYRYRFTSTVAESTAALLFRDEETGTTFTVPANWKEKELSQERQTIDNKFCSTDGESTILYGSIDIWNIIPFFNRIFRARNDYNISNISPDEMRDYFKELGAEGISLSKEVISGVEYYKCVASTKEQVYGLEFDVVMTQYLTLLNGYGYLFQFGGTENDTHYQDFMDLLQSVEYKSDRSQFNYLGIIIVSTIAIVIIMVCVIITKKTRRKTVKNYAGNPSESKKLEPHFCYCHKCGKRIPISSSFCPHCGEKLIDKHVRDEFFGCQR